MQNNLDDIKYKAFENTGWTKVKSQLDIEMPEKKKDRRLIVWWFFGIVGLGLIGYLFRNHVSPFVQSLEIKTINSTDLKETETTNDIQTLPEVAQTMKSTTETTFNQAQRLNEEETNNKNIALGKNKGNHLLENAQSINSLADRKKITTKNGTIARKSNTDEITAFSKENKNITNQFKQSLPPKDHQNISEDKDINLSVDHDKNVVPTLSDLKLENQMELFNSSTLSDKNLKRYVINIVPIKSVWQEIIYHRMFTLTKTTEQSDDFIDIVSGNKIKSSNFLIEAGIEYSLPSPSSSTSYFTQATSLGYKFRLGSKFYMITNGGLAFPFSKESLYLDNQGRLNADNSAGANFGLSNKSNGSVSSPNGAAIEKILLDPSRSITSVSNNVLYITNNDQVRVNTSGAVLYDLRLKLGYQLNKRLFFESGISLRDELKNKASTITVVSQAQSTAVNAFTTQSYEFSALNRQARIHLLGTIGYVLSSKLRFSGNLNIPYFNSGNILYNSSFTDPRTVPLSTAKDIKLPVVKDLSFGLNIRYNLN